MKNPARLVQNSTTDAVWLHRLKKLLDLCIIQLITIQQTSQAIPLRMLETFTAESSIERYVENEQLIQNYLDSIFRYLVDKDYYKRLRILLEQKCPPLDGETLQSPNQFSEAIFQLMLRPLLLSNKAASGFSYGNIICQSFTKHILALPFSDCVRYFLLPCLAECTEFPFEYLLKTLQQSTRAQLPEKMQVDSSPLTTFTGASTAESLNSTSNSPLGKKERNEKTQESTKIFSTFLLHSLLILDRKQFGQFMEILFKV